MPMIPLFIPKHQYKNVYVDEDTFINYKNLNKQIFNNCQKIPVTQKQNIHVTKGIGEDCSNNFIKLLT